MALDTFLPQFFSQDFEPSEMFEFPYVLFATDRSGMVPAGGNQVTWPDVEGSVTTQAYTRGTNLTDGEGRDAIITLTVNQQDAVAIPLDDTDRTQRMPQIMAEYAMQSNRELIWKVNANNRAAFRAATRLAPSGLTQPMRGSYNGLTSNVASVDLKASGASGTTIDSVDGRAAVIRAMDQQAGVFAKRHGWISTDADTKGVCIVPIEIGNQFREFLWNDKPNLGVGSIVDSAFGLGQIMKISGWEVVEDATQPEVDLTQAGNVHLDFVHPQRRGLYYARQLSSIETERIQGQFGTRLKALYMHGATQGAARHLYQLQLALTT